MKTLKVTRIAGTAVALTPISHGEISPEGVETNIIRFRRLPVLSKLPSGDIAENRVPVISGNAVRGLGRRLLFDTMVDALGGRQKLEEYLPSDAKNKKLIWYFLRVGGTTEKGVKIQSTDYKTYIEMQEKIPTLALLGGNFQGHQFESSCRIGFMVALTEETKVFFREIMQGTESAGWKLIEETAEEIFGDKAFPYCSVYSENIGNIYTGRSCKEIRYTRMREPGIEEGLKEGSIYGIEVMPAGTMFGQLSVLCSDDEPVKLAFKAMLALIQRRGILGGMCSKGHGMVKIRYSDIDPDRDIKAFTEYCQDHENEIKEAVKSIPDALKYSSKDSKTNENKESEEKEVKKRGGR